MNYLVFLLQFAYVMGFNPDQYTHTKTMWKSNDEDIYKVHWSITGKFINLALEVKTLGWIGFGIAEQTSGTMGGSDIVQGFVKDGKPVFEDRFALSQLPGTNVFTAPITDKCQDWQLINGEETNGKTILELRRLIDTGDSQDRPILLNQPTKIIMAYGADDEDAFVQHSRKRRKASSIQFSGESVDSFKALKNNPLIRSFDFLGKWTVTTNKTLITNQNTDDGTTWGQYVDDATTYVNFMMDISSLLKDGDISIVGVEHVINEHTAEFVHHFGMGGMFWNGTAATSYMGIYGWAPGVEPMVLEKCGFRASSTDETAFNMLTLNTHYDNPEFKEGMEDNSGVRVYYTRKSLVDCGFMSVGQADAVKEENNYLPLGKSLYEYTGKSTSSIDWKVPEVTLLYSFLHMHLTGREMWTEHYRNGTSLGTISRIDFWDFNFQSVQKLLTGEVKFKKGDSLKTTCVFDTNQKTKFGLASQDEMCLDMYIYYPRIPELDYFFMYKNPYFFTDNMVKRHEQITDFTRAFGKVKDKCPSASLPKMSTASRCILNVSPFLVLVCIGIFFNF